MSFDCLSVCQYIPCQLAGTPKEQDFLQLHVATADLHPDFAQALTRFHTYKEKIIDGYRQQYTGDDLEQRIRRVESDNHITARHHDLAVITVIEDTPSISIARIDVSPPDAGDRVQLVGYGCEVGKDQSSTLKHGRRRWGETQVIRIDPVSFYTFAHQMRLDAPSLCPGDSGGPVSARARVRGTWYGVRPFLGERSNMSVNLREYKAWSLIL